MKPPKAFTLLELLVVIVIVAFLSAIVGGIFGQMRRNNSVEDPTAYMSISDKAFYEEQKRANDIRERELQLQYQQQQK